MRKTPEQIRQQLPDMSIAQIADVVLSDWQKVYFGAVPYLNAMSTLETIKDKYIADDGKSIVTYFVSNSQTWRGEVARMVKAELNKRIKNC